MVNSDGDRLGADLGARFDIVVNALRRLAVADEMAGMGDVSDPEGIQRIAYARRALAKVGLDQKKRS